MSWLIFFSCMLCLQLFRSSLRTGCVWELCVPNGVLYVLWTLSSWEHFDEASHAVLIIITALPPFCIRAFSKILWVQERCHPGCALELRGVSGAAWWFASQSVGFVPNKMWKHMIAIPFSVVFQIWVRSKFQFGAFTFLTPFQPRFLFS